MALIVINWYLCSDNIIYLLKLVNHKMAFVLIFISVYLLRYILYNCFIFNDLELKK